MDISDTLAPKSDQLDAVDLISGPRIFTITKVDVRPGADQPVSVHFAEFPRVWRPCKNMRRVLAFCWSNQSAEWVGRRVEVFFDDSVVYAGAKVGGTRISRLSHIDGPLSAPIIPTRGKSALWPIDPLPELSRADELRAEWRTADPERKKAIEAEVAALNEAGQ